MSQYRYRSPEAGNSHLVMTCADDMDTSSRKARSKGSGSMHTHHAGLDFIIFLTTAWHPEVIAAAAIG